MTGDIIASIDALKAELDRLRPLPPDVTVRVAQKLRLESSYHSNAIEGNTLTLGETRGLILHGLTAQGKPLRHHLDIEGHDDAVKAIEDAVTRGEALNGVFIRNLHTVLLREPYEMDAVTPDGRPTKRLISVGRYKTAPNNVRTSTGEIHYYTPPEQVDSAMNDLIEWYRDQDGRGEHPIIVAATFHYRFVRIHPFDDGNGRLARLLMNMILIRHGYTVAIIEAESRDQYIREIEEVARTDTLSQFIEFIASCCEYSLDLHLRAARGESIEDPGDIDREIAIFKRSLHRRGGGNAPVDGRRYVDTVVLPLREYCNHKLNLFVPEPFVWATEAYVDVKGEKKDGTTFFRRFGDIRIDKQRPVPKDVVSIRMESLYFLRDFLATALSVEILVEGEHVSDGSRWSFRADISGRGKKYDRAYNGEDLAELKKCFDDLLRWVMGSIGREASTVPSAAGEAGHETDSGQGRSKAPLVDGLRGWIRRRLGRVVKRK